MDKITTLVGSEELNSLASRVDLKNFESKKILITGGTGLIGAYMTTVILEGCELLGLKSPRVTITTKSGRYDRLMGLKMGQNLRVVRVNSPADLPSDEFNLVIHAASPASPLKYTNDFDILEANVGYMRQILMNANEIETLLFISSGEVYGPLAPNPIPEDYEGVANPAGRRSSYPIAKKQTEELLLNCDLEGTNKRIVRLFHTYGPGLSRHDGRSFSDFLTSASKGMHPNLHSNGEQIRTFCYLEDSIAGIFTVLFSSYNGPVNVGSENPVSVLDFARLVSKFSGLNGEVEFSDAPPSHATSPNNVIVPNTQLLQSLGWREEIPLCEGIQRALKWLKMSKEL